MKRSLRKTLLMWSIAGSALAQKNGLPPPAPAVASELERAQDAVGFELQHEMVKLQAALRALKELPPMPPLPPMPALPLIDLQQLQFDLLDAPFAPGALLAQAAPPAPPARKGAAAPALAPLPPVPPAGWKYAGERVRTRDSEEGMYRRGSSLLDRRDWDRAVEAFDQVIAYNGAKADGASYWKAYALSKLGRRDEALAAIAEMRKKFPNSRWTDDAKALEVEVRQASGQAVLPEAQADEDLKLFAINSLMGSDPERAVPLLDKLLKSTTSPRLKERALFVLAQNRSAQAKDIVVQFAKGRGNPDLQLKAVEFLGASGKDALPVLSEVYSATNDPAIRRRVLQAYMQNRDKDRLLAAAKSDPNPDLRRDAVQWLGAIGAQADLAQLYSTESSIEVRENIMRALMMSRSSDKLIELARTEKEPKLRRSAIHWLGTMKSPETADALAAMYGTESDPELKRQIIHSLFLQENAKAIIDLARKETNPDLKRDAVHKLSMMKSKEATDFMVELLK